MEIGKKQVKCWRDRYSRNREKIALIEKETPKKLRSAIIEPKLPLKIIPINARSATMSTEWVN